MKCETIKLDALFKSTFFLKRDPCRFLWLVLVILLIGRVECGMSYLINIINNTFWNIDLVSILVQQLNVTASLTSN